MKKNVIVSLADSNYFELLNELVDSIKSFEKDILEKIRNEKNDILSTILTTGKLEKDTEESLIQIIEEYKKVKNNA